MAPTAAAKASPIDPSVLLPALVMIGVLDSVASLGALPVALAAAGTVLETTPVPTTFSPPTAGTVGYSGTTATVSVLMTGGAAT
jgi:hypothetical protein